MLAVCEAAASKIGPPVRGAEPLWSCVEALRAAGSGGFAAGMALEASLFSRVSAACCLNCVLGNFGCGGVCVGCVLPGGLFCDAVEVL